MSLMFDFVSCCAAPRSWSDQLFNATEKKQVEPEEKLLQGQLDLQAREVHDTSNHSSLRNSRAKLKCLFAFAISLAVVAGALVGIKRCSLAESAVILLVAVACALKASYSWFAAHPLAHELPPQLQARTQPELTKSCEAISTLMACLDKLGVTDPSLQLDEGTCRRFLTAYKGDIDGATEGLQRYVQWRKEMRPADITVEDIKVELATRKGYVAGLDRRGQPILWAFAGRHDKNIRDVDETERLILFSMERAVKLGNSSGSEKICLVFDLSGFGPKSMDYEIVKRLFLILARFYPERLGQVLLCDAPSVFSVFWRVISPYIDPVTFQKIKFVRKGELSEFIDPWVLPQDDVRMLELMSS